MSTIVLTTVRWAPRSGVQVTVCCSTSGWEHVAGVYREGEWRFVLPESDADVEYKFVLDGEHWEQRDNRVVGPGTEVVVGDDDISFPIAPIEAREDRATRRFFPADRSGAHEYDVVIVGSGLGGGVLADQLSDRGKDVLVLEAGPYLFPTHVANLPREHVVGVFSKHIWELYGDFAVQDYRKAPGSEDYDGALAYNLGGRSVFWGGLIPRLGEWELATWPAAVREYLLGGGFDEARRIVHGTEMGTELQERFLDLLDEVLPDHAHRAAPMAVQYKGVTDLAIPVGMFSTADLLLESRLTRDREQARRPTINVNHRVDEILIDGDRATGVRSKDLVTGQTRTYRGKDVVLAAGTLGSARLALASQLEDPSELLGVGITDHPIWFVHFAVPPNTPTAGDDSAKTWSRPTDAGSESGQYNLVVELGADRNQNRFVDEDTWRRQQEELAGKSLGELVVLFNAGLVERNRVTLDQGSVVVDIHPAPIAPAAQDRARQAAAKVLEKIGAEPLPDKTLDLRPARLGGVAHEVGTLRMGDGDGVVTPDLQFRAYQNLYACDLSILPSSPAGNPSLALVALAQRLAERLAGGA